MPRLKNPEIAIVAFAYNGKEGSQVALPMVRMVMDAYFKLKEEPALALAQ